MVSFRKNAKKMTGIGKAETRQMIFYNTRSCKLACKGLRLHSFTYRKYKNDSFCEKSVRILQNFELVSKFNFL